MVQTSTREGEEFHEAEKLLQSLPHCDDSPTTQDASALRNRPSLYWHGNIVYQHRYFLMHGIEGGIKDMEFLIRDIYYDPNETSTGNKTWSTSHLFALWIYQHKSLFAGKKVVLEVGTGCSGLPGRQVMNVYVIIIIATSMPDSHIRIEHDTGMVAALYACQVYLSDKSLTLLANVEHNLKLNESILGTRSICTKSLDWNEVASSSSISLPPATVIIGSEVLYEAMNPKALVVTLSTYLTKEESEQPRIYLAIACEGRGNMMEFDRALTTQGFTFSKAPLSQDLVDPSRHNSSRSEVPNISPSEIFLYTIQRG